jgi:hypothetical protein
MTIPVHKTLIFVALVGRLAAAYQIGGEPELIITVSAALPTSCENGCRLQVVGPSVAWLSNGAALWLTLNSGRDWQSRQIPQMRPGDYATFGFSDRKAGWIFTASQHLFLTTDGAEHWAPVAVPSLDGVLQAAWAQPETGLLWLAGGVYRDSTQPDAPNYALKRSAEGWATLHPIVLSRDSAGNWARHDLRGCSWTVTFVQGWPTNSAVAVGDGCSYYYGETENKWSVATMHTRGRSGIGFGSGAAHAVVHFLTADKGWLTFDNHAMFRTSDGGRNWYSISRQAPVLDELRFVSERHGFGVSHDSKLYETVDGGTTWNRVNIGFRVRWVCSAGNGRGWLLSDSHLYAVRWK